MMLPGRLQQEASPDRNATLMDAPPNKRTLPVRLAGTAGRKSSNLALALLLLPPDRRRDAFLFHDFCRTVDDIADSSSLGIMEKQDALDAWLQVLQPPLESGLPQDFLEMITRRNLDRHLLSEILRGMRMDTEQNRYASFEELKRYCWRVASVVGLISAELFGGEPLSERGMAVKTYAEELGVALQLTNILRDVGEDAEINRIYLPLEDLARFSVDEREILEKLPSPAMTHLLNFQAERADAFFAKAEIAWSEMSTHQRRIMRPARLMSIIYRKLLLKMHRDCYDVLQRTYHVSLFEKLICIAQITLIY